MEQIIRVLLWTVAVFAGIVLHLALKPNTAKKTVIATVVLTAVAGLAVYSYGYACVEGSLVTAVIQTVFAVCRIFIGEEAFGDIADAPLAASAAFRAVFWLVHLMGFFSTTSVAIATLGAGALRRARLWLNRSRALAVIFGLNEDTMEFARRLLEEKKVSPVFVDENPEESLTQSAEEIGCVVRSDPAALDGTARFLKSIGLRRGKRQIWLYALHPDIIADRQYAQGFMDALASRKIRPEQSNLTIRGREDEMDSRFQAAGARYGFGNVFSLDDPEMTARLLMHTYPPCDTICFDDTGRATEDFHALVIGFEKVGQAVLRQLVMNGQFEGSRFRSAVFAPDYAEHMGYFGAAYAPMLKHYDISFFAHHAGSCRMYQYLQENLHTLRYVAVCLDNDTENARIGEELQRYLSQNGSTAQVCLCNHRGVRSASGDKQTNLYTPQILCSDRIDRMAMVLNHTYCAGGDIRENWKNCDYFSRMSSRASADFAYALLKSAHTTAEEALKRWSPEGARMENLAKTEHLRWCGFHYAMGFRAMTDEEFEARAARYRAGEKLRLGKDLQNRIHACMVSWDGLDALSEKENAVTGGHVDYKQMDRNNVLSLPDVLHAMEEV